MLFGTFLNIQFCISTHDNNGVHEQSKGLVLFKNAWSDNVLRPIFEQYLNRACCFASITKYTLAVSFLCLLLKILTVMHFHVWFSAECISNVHLPFIFALCPHRCTKLKRLQQKLNINLTKWISSFFVRFFFLSVVFVFCFSFHSFNFFTEFHLGRSPFYRRCIAC